jgi:hypothetical protein
MVMTGDRTEYESVARDRERPHQGIGNMIIIPEYGELPEEKRIECRSRLGGILNYYHRKAAGNRR